MHVHHGAAAPLPAVLPAAMPDEAMLSPICTAMSQALGMADFSLVVVDAQAEVRFAEDQALGRLERAGLRISFGRLGCEDEVTTGRLRRAVRQVAAGAPPIAVAGEASDSQIIVVPLPALAQNRQLVFVLATIASHVPHEDRLQAAYGLTRAEARLLQALVAGSRLSEYASETGVSETTVKTHLQKLFDKTGERRQSDLIRRALNDPRLRMHLD